MPDIQLYTLLVPLVYGLAVFALLLLINAHWEELPFTLPLTKDEQMWETLVDTRDPELPLRMCRMWPKSRLHRRASSTSFSRRRGCPKYCVK